MGKLGKRKRAREADVGDFQVTSEPTDDLQDAVRALEMLSRRLDIYASKASKQLRVAVFPLIQRQQKAQAHFEPPAWAGQPPPSEAEAAQVLGPSSPAATALIRLCTGPLSGEDAAKLLASADFKDFRRALHPLVLEQYRREGKPVPAHDQLGLSSRISSAFRNRDWPLALSLLRRMAQSDERPKLGAIQRWVRDCDLATQPAPLVPVSTMASDPTDDAADGGADGPQLQAAAPKSQPAGSEATAAAAAAVDASYSTSEGAASDGGNTALLLLDAVMRAGAGRQSAAAASSVMRAGAGQRDGAAATSMSSSIASKNAPGLPQRAVVTRAPLFTVVPRWVRGAEEQPSRIEGTSFCSSLELRGSAAAAAAAAALSAGAASAEAAFPLGAGNLPPAPPLPPAPAVWSRERVLPNFRFISHVPGPQRRPPSEDDLRIYTAKPGTIVFDSYNQAKSAVAASVEASEGAASSSAPYSVGWRVRRHEVPDVPGAFLLSDVLTPSECGQLLHTAHAIGYQRDGIDGIGAVVWLADESLLGPLFARVQGLLPPQIGGCALKGLNARLRLFRYHPGAVYRPHIDGSWPGSGLDSEGRLTDDAFPGTRVSRLTFLIYLNGGFDGGATTFFLPGHSGDGHIAAYGVQPQEGSVLCFPHGDSDASLVHEGSAVAPGGAKYIIRTDVLYATSPAHN